MLCLRKTNWLICYSTFAHISAFNLLILFVGYQYKLLFLKGNNENNFFEITMTYYTDYLEEISTRKNQGLHAKPIDNHSLMEEIIQQIKDENNVYRKDSLHFLFTIHYPVRQVPLVQKLIF